MSAAQVIDTPNVEVTWDNIDVVAPSIEDVKIESQVEVKEESKEAVIDDSKVEEKDSKESEKDVKQPTKEVKEELSVSDETEVEVKIDGKLEKISLKDLKNNYSGKVAYDRKFTELDKQNKQVTQERTKLQQEINQVNQYVNTFAEKMRNRDAVGAMSYLAEFSGMSPAAIKQTLINQLIPEINRQAGLTEAERDLELTKEEIAFQKAQQQRELQKLQQENSQKSLELANTKARSEHGISMNEWDEAFEFLDTHVEKGKAITRKDVVDYALWKRADDRASTVLQTYDSGKYLQDKTVRDTLTKIASENPDFSQQDLDDVLKEAFKGKVEENVKKVAVAKNVQNKPRDDKGKFTYSSQALTSWDF
jgi:cell division protein FtsB